MYYSQRVKIGQTQQNTFGDLPQELFLRFSPKSFTLSNRALANSYLAAEEIESLT
jgi:hypothetical protein